MQKVVLAPHKATIWFDSEVNDHSIAALVDDIQAVSQELFYREIDLQILSPGGSVLSLNYYLAALEGWADSVRIHTCALTAVASASAIILSLGNVRRASAASQLLYHGARVPGAAAITARAASRMREDLEAIDNRLLRLLAARAFNISTSDWVERWQSDFNEDEGAEAGVFGIPEKAHWMKRLGGNGSESDKLDFLLGVYRGVFMVDRPISARLTRRIGLIDIVDQADSGIAVDRSERNAESALSVPEWTSIFPPDGLFALQYLKRHIMIFGETGSGKTASGVLPIVNAIVRSCAHKDARRVSCALVIDPKREIAGAITRMGGEPIMIDPGVSGRAPDRRVFNLMEHIEQPRDVLGQARAVLMRVGGLIQSPASMLLGKQPDPREQYWVTDGLRMATTVLGLTLLVLKYQRRIYNDEGLLRADLKSAAGGLGPALETLAEKAGLSTLTPVARRKIRDAEAWMEGKREEYERLRANLRRHGFQVQAIGDSQLRVDEIRDCSLKVYGLDVYRRWVVERSTGRWRGYSDSAVSVDRIGFDVTQVEASLKECASPSETITIAEAESVDVTFSEGSPRECVGMARLPILLRDTAELNDMERMDVVLDLQAELEKMCERKERDREEFRLLESAVVEKLNGLKGECDGQEELNPSSLLLLPMLGELLDPAAPFLPALKWEETTDEYGLTWRSREEAKPAATFEEYEIDSCGDPCPEDIEEQDDWSLTGYNGSVRALSRAIEHGRRHRTVVDDYGIELCRILRGDESEGRREWTERLRRKASERTERLQHLVSLCEDIRTRVSKVDEKFLKPRRFFLVTHTRKPGPQPLFDGGADVWEEVDRGLLSYRAYVESLRENRRRVTGDGAVATGENVMALAHHMLMDAFKLERVGAWAGLLEKLSSDASFEDEDLESNPTLLSHVRYFSELAAKAETQYLGVHGSANGCFREISEGAAAGTLYFGCEPYWDSVKREEKSGTNLELRAVSFASVLGDREKQRVFVLQPELQGSDFIGRALKALFFESVLRDERRQKAGHDEPLVAYVADEFHRFITADRVHGEQSFLDTCRSFGVFCVLATQSTASMTHALLEIEANDLKVNSAIAIILNNTGTKLFFRTTDVATKQRLGLLAPVSTRPGLQSVVDVRPPTTLAPGECYAMAVDGRFARAQLKQWVPDSGENGSSGPGGASAADAS